MHGLRGSLSGDTVPTLGADDSAIAVCLEAAKVLALRSGASPVVAIFNRDEDGLLGSTEFGHILRSERRS